MSEKRFVCIDVDYGDDWYITDNGKRLSEMEIVDLLNEQQATITELERKLKKYAKIGEEQLKQIMELQDLCGQSDSENAKLRQEIKELKAQLREKEEDEQLYANEIVKLNKEAKEVLDFKSLGGDY